MLLIGADEDFNGGKWKWLIMAKARVWTAKLLDGLLIVGKWKLGFRDSKAQ